jgi:hypothetical protein
VDRLPQADRHISINSEVFEAVDAQLSSSIQSIANDTTTANSDDSQAFTDIPGAATHAALKDLALTFEASMARLEIAEALEEVVRCLRLVRL